MKKDLFQFKRFSVNQSGCGMKVNTDGVLLGALIPVKGAAHILDIGTGTGVIALMMAQRFPKSIVEGLEIDLQAAQTAKQNFAESGFSGRLTLHHHSFQEFSELNPAKRYDLIVSNPPFFTNSLRSSDRQKQIARHVDKAFFSELILFLKAHLTPAGVAHFILPPEASAQVQEEASLNELYLQHVLDIRSFANKMAHRQIVSFGFDQKAYQKTEFVIYKAEKQYSEAYQQALKEFLTIF